MWQKHAADAILAMHFGWIAFVIVGQLLIMLGIVLRWRWIRNFAFRFLHLFMMVVVALESMFAVPCPMTVWERRLRGLQPGDILQYTESDSLIAQYLGNLIFVDSESGPGAIVFVTAYVSFAALIIVSFLVAPPRLPMSPARFMALLYGCIGVLFLATFSWLPGWGLWYPGLGLFFSIEAFLWYRLGGQRTEDRSQEARGRNQETGIQESGARAGRFQARADS
jgi:hypothetical protein